MGPTAQHMCLGVYLERCIGDIFISTTQYLHFRFIILQITESHNETLKIKLSVWRSYREEYAKLILTHFSKYVAAASRVLFHS